MPDSLPELLRQRGLIQQHLAWLEMEIALAERKQGASLSSAKSPVPSVPGAGSSAPALSTAPAIGNRNVDTPPVALASLPVENADEILARYQAEPDAMEQEVRRGCIRSFVILMVVMLGGVTLFYQLWRRSYDARNAGASATPAAIHR